MNKVQWRRQEGGGIELYVEEDGKWKGYKNSKCYVADPNIPNISRGLATFQNCLKAGYQVIDVNGDPI